MVLLGGFSAKKRQASTTMAHPAIFLGYLQENGINGTYWAAGPWWDTYFMAITPKDGKDRPQMPIIEKYTSTLKK